MKDRKNCIVVMTGTSEHSAGGITSVIKLIKQMPVWEDYGIYWLETQADGNLLKKLWCVIIAAIKSPFCIAKSKIVHFQMVPGITLVTQFPALFFAKLFNKKIVMTIHIGNQLEPYAKDKIFKWWLNRSDLILLLAKRWEKLFVELYPDVKVPLDVLYNACEIRPFISMKDKKKLILFAGTHDTNKAPDLLINAWATLKDSYPDWQIAFCGNGNVSYYKKIANEKGLDDSVVFKGYIVGDEKEQYFHDASVLCLCSYMEGFPMTVLEAWSHGIAVITTPVGGLPDVIEDGSNCLVFPTGDSDKLAEQLSRIIGDEALRERIGMAGYKCAQDVFSFDVINKKLDDIYSKMIS